MVNPETKGSVKKEETPEIYEGVLELFWETGTEGGYWALQDERFISNRGTEKESYSFEGLRILRDGDVLTIFSREDKAKVVWEGVISLQQRSSFEENVNGFRIHANQKGIEREKWAEWFFDKYPAKLVTRNS